MLSLRQIEPSEERKPIVEANLALARYFANRFVPKSSTPIEDTEEYAEALMAMARAEQSYDPSFGRFASYASPAICNALIDFQKKKQLPTVALIDDYEEPQQEPIIPVECLQEILVDHENDTEIDLRNKTMMCDHYLHGESLQSIGERYAMTRMGVYTAIQQYIGKLRTRHDKLIQDVLS